MLPRGHIISFYTRHFFFSKGHGVKKIMENLPDVYIFLEHRVPIIKLSLSCPIARTTGFLII